jgi:hypothetical protein
MLFLRVWGRCKKFIALSRLWKPRIGRILLLPASLGLWGIYGVVISKG